MNIFIVGSGKLANALIQANLSFQNCKILKWEPSFKTSNSQAIVVHAGSGRQLNECIEFCSETKSVFIELSTGLTTETMSPDFPLIICPNTSILVLKLLNLLKHYGSNFADYNITLTESHQSTKTTEPGTAYAFAHSLNLSPEKVISIRDPKVQRNTIGIPENYIDKHAYHKIVIKDGEDEITLETKVLGHNSYASGVKKIIDAILQHTLENKKHTVLDLIENKTL